MNQLKNLCLPKWFPYPSCWLKALIMSWSMMIFFLGIKYQIMGNYFWHKILESRELLICLSIIFLLSLIPLMAFLHHFLQLLFQNIRQIINYKYQYKLFFFPESNCWWKALYNWLVIIISTLTAILVYTLMLPWFDLSYQAIILNNNNFLYPHNFPEKFLLFVFISIWIIVAAKLYQFEFLYQKAFFLNPATSGRKINKSTHGKLPAPEIRKNPQKEKDNQRIQPQTNLNLKENELAKYTTNYRVNQITKFKASPQTINRNYYKKNYLKKLQKAFRKNILILLIIPLLGLSVYSLSRWQLVSQTPVNIVSDIPSPIEDKFNSEDLQIEQTTNQPTPSNSPITKSSPISSGTILLAPPDPFKLAVNRAISAAEMVQSAQSKLEWEAIAIQWQDAAELMKIVPPSHPQYTLARKKIREYQSYSDYAQRVAKISPE